MTTQSQTEALLMALEVFKTTLKTLTEANNQGIITDTLWFSDYETLFDRIGVEIDVLECFLAQQSNEQGCEHCNHSLYCGTKCKNCGKQSNEQVEEKNT